MAASILVNIFTTRIVLQALGESDYGLYNVVGGAIAMLGFISASMSTAVQRFLNYAEGEGQTDRIRSIFGNSVLIHRIIALLLVAIFVVAGFFFFNGILNIPDGRRNVAIAVYGCMLFSTVFSTTIVPYDAALNAHENMLWYSIIGIADVGFKFVIAIIIAHSNADRLLFYAILMAVESWLVRFITQQYCRQHYDECRNIDIRDSFDRKIVKELASFAGWNLTNTASSMIALYGMNIIVNHFFGTKVNAAMGVATQLNGVLMGVSMNMIKALSPVMMKKEGCGEREQMLNLSYVGCKISYLLFSFVCIPVMAVLPFLLRLWLKAVPEWTEQFCYILLAATLVDQLTVFLYQTIAAEGHVRNYNITRSIINIVSLAVGIAIFATGDLRPYWIFINWLFFKSVLCGIASLYYSRKNAGLSIKRYFKRVMVPCASVTVCMLVVGFVAIRFSSTAFWTQTAVLAGLYIASIPIYWFLGFNVSERSVMSGIIKVRRK